MIRFFIVIFITAFGINSMCQINHDTLIGKYVQHSEIGGGFTGGPNGSCMITPPDLVVDNIISIDSNFVVSKISDTTGWSHYYSAWDCDTLYKGKAEIIADTIIVTYTLKKECTPFLAYNKPFENLTHPIIEKYYVWVEEGQFIGIIRCGTGYWDAYEKRNEVAPTK